jgi:virginiamycin A acetyltransferase
MANIFQKFLGKIFFGKKSNLYQILKSDSDANLFHNANVLSNSKTGNYTKLYSPYKLIDSKVGDYTYVAQNSILLNTNVGRFCSFGPNLISGWGTHPLNGISTHPMFYSTKKQNGMTLSADDKFEELKPIEIGNDVFIGMNVSIIDGVKIGHGAVIGAGAVVSKDIPPYAIAVGCPIQIKGYRFDEETIKKLLELKWWDFNEIDLREVEKNFFNVEQWLKNQKI